MSGSLRWWAALSLGVLALVGAPVLGRPRPVPAPSPRQSGYQPSTFAPAFNSNPLIAPGLSLQQAKYNTAQLGGTQTQLLQSMGLTGRNLSLPLTAAALGSGGPLVSGGIPYRGAGGWLVALPAMPYGSGYILSSAPWGAPYGGYYPFLPYGGYYPSVPYGGYPSVPYGGYSPSVPYGGYSPPTPYGGGGYGPPPADRAATLKSAPKDPPKTEVWSGRALNASFRSIIHSGKLNRGPNIPLSHATLAHLNLTDGGPKGSAGLLQKIDKLKWPLALKESRFDKARVRLTRNLRLAVDDLKDKAPIVRAELQDITSDFQALNTTLYDSADDLAPAEYIEAKHFLNRLKSAIAVVSDPRAAKDINTTWNAKGENVAELLSYMVKEGLEFAPAAEGDEAAYTALYQALRALEAGMRTASK